MIEESPFVAIPAGDHLAANASAFAVADAHPVSVGHTLIIPRRLIGSWWELGPAEQADVLALLAEVRAILRRDHAPDGFNVGFNDGAAAGQTVAHFHLHVIPRWIGDAEDPRGGVRHVLPGGNWQPAQPIGDPGVAEAATARSAARHRARTLRLIDGSGGFLHHELLRLFADADHDRIDLVVSFILLSGLRLIEGAIEDALDRGARLRVLTTDYLGVTEQAALGWLLDRADLRGDALQTRVFSDPRSSFHPKAYLFWSAARQRGVGLVGSSNLSHSGIAGGIEWNLRVDDLPLLRAGFDRLWDEPRSRPLTADWLARYRPRAPLPARSADVPAVGAATVDGGVPPVPVGADGVEATAPAAPTAIQREALAALEQSRAAGYRAGLVVMATGLGKTWLAAFDTTRPAFRRVLFVAHREEILRQARDVFRQIDPSATMGMFVGDERQPDAPVLFASVQSLARQLDRFPADRFDYVVVDEFHHAAAASYRRVIDHFEPGFLLGLTATPDRMDGADLLALCGDNRVFECNLVEAIDRSELVPFDYHGVPDVVDFEPIPWRNGRFDPAALTQAVETIERADHAYREWDGRRGGRTLAFCCSTTHADFMADQFRRRGVRAASVHSGESSDPRHSSIERLTTGDLDVVFSVDLFNEGLDVPAVDTVLMLRPTESPVLFLQQLGRGLRRWPDKERLTVIDFIGNHRSFLLKPRTLLSLGPRPLTTGSVLDAMGTGDFGLPDGCSVHYDLEQLPFFQRLRTTMRGSASDTLADYCRSHLEEEGFRPTAGQAFRAGLNPRSVSRQHSGWFGFLDDLGLLETDEAAVLGRHGSLLEEIETSNITKSYKLVTLKALLHQGALVDGLDVDELADVSQWLVASDPRLVRDTTGKEMPDPAGADPASWRAFWRKWPIAAWLGELAGGADGLFHLADGSRFALRTAVPTADADTLSAMVAELVEYRLSRYLAGKEAATKGEAVCPVSHASGNPIVRLDRQRHPWLPEGEDVPFTADGQRYVGDFRKVALNVARRPGEKGNALRALLRGWFGPSAGHPGTHHRVAFAWEDGTLVMRPVGVGEAGNAGPEGVVVPLYPTYQVACGAFAEPATADHAASHLTMRPSPGVGDSPPALDPEQQFVAFARGESMAGGPDPIRHGDPLLFQWARGVSRDDLVGQRVLAEYRDGPATAAALKVLDRVGGHYLLSSTAPGFEPIEGDASMHVVARLVRRLDQAEINPLTRHIGELFKRQDIAPLYGQDYNPGNWASGHVSLPGHAVLFVTLEKSSAMATGADYVDHFEGDDTLVWSSQASAGPDSKKGREILEALDTGTQIHLWVRRRKADVAFRYCGLAVPMSHQGDRPMSVRLRLYAGVPDGFGGG